MPAAHLLGILRGFILPRALILIVATGCVLPIPRPETRVAESRRPLQSDANSFLAAGVARDDVLLKLGEPDYIWNDGRTLIYAWTTTKLTLLVAASGGYQGAAGALDAPINYALRIDFDPEGRVQRWETRKAPWGVDGTTFIDRLGAEQ